MGEIPIAPIRRIIKNSGAERVSDDASLALATVLEEVGNEVSQLATQYAHHAGRKTVKLDDVVLASDTILE